MLGSLNSHRNSFTKPNISTNSILGSFETVDSLYQDPVHERSRVLVPRENKNLFNSISPETNETYENMPDRLKKTIEMIEDIISPVSVLDECSITAKPVFLRLPNRRRTEPIKLV